MAENFRSGCPIASTLDLMGDKWSLLLIRDMLLHHKATFKEFSASAEHIAPSTLSARLKLLTSHGLVAKYKLATNQKENIYVLTDKAIALADVIVDLSIWGNEYMGEFNRLDPIEGLDTERAVMVTTIKNRYRSAIEAL